jgi:hypothetical protein
MKNNINNNETGKQLTTRTITADAKYTDIILNNY